jgi:hypothetical protein
MDVKLHLLSPQIDRPDGGFLISGHEAAVTHDVSREDGGEVAFGPFGVHSLNAPTEVGPF